MSDAGALTEAYGDLVEIGRGPEGMRYAATMLDGTPVTVLAIAAEVGSRIVAPERFDAEFQRAAAVHHSALVPPVAWGALSDGTWHCAYGRLETQELTPGSLSPAMVAGIGVHAARGLFASHASGVVHGAICSSRIVLVAHRGPLIADLGLFNALSEGGLGPQDAFALLTPSAYRAPETQGPTRAPDAKSDIYSLGASLYELLTGKTPYGGRMTSYVLASVLSDEAASGGTAEPATSSDAKSPSHLVIDALVRAIEQDPDDRWPTADALASALAASVSTGEIAAVASRRRRLGCLPAAGAALIASGLVRALFV